MKLLSLKVQGFRSFRKQQTYEFSQRAGLFLVRGDNQLEPELGANGCLVGDTLIDCPRDLKQHPHGVPIRDLVGTTPWVYTKVGDGITVGKASRVWLTKKKAKVVRVRLRGLSGKARKFPTPLELVGTADHPVLLSDGSWKAIGDLAPGDSIFSLYRRTETDNYTLLRWTGWPYEKKPPVEHQVVCSAVHGPRPDGHHAHHKNGNSLDHRPENLEWVEASEHLANHLSARNRKGEVGWKVSGRHPRGMLGKTHSKEAKRAIGRASSRPRPELHNRVTKECEFCGDEFTRAVSFKARFCSRGCWNAFRRRVNHTVVSVEDAGCQDVYDMAVPGTHNFIANGLVVHNSGKSTFWDAVCWCFYGKTVRGISGPAVESWKGKTATQVAIEVEIDGTVCTIERTRKPIHLRIDSGEVTQQNVDELLGLSYERFLQVVIMGQFGTMFPDMKPTARLDLLTEVLELEFWTKASAEANRTVRQLQEQVTALDRLVHGCRERLGGLYEQREKLEDDSRKWDETQKAALRDGRKAVQKAEDAVDTMDREIKDAAKAVQDLTKEHDRASQGVKACTGVGNKARQARSKEEGRTEALRENHSQARERMKELEDFGSTCPVCEQAVTGARHQDLFHAAEDKLADAEKALDDHRETLKKLKGEIETVEEVLDKAERKERAVWKGLVDAKEHEQRLRSKAGERRGQLRAAEKALQKLEDEENPIARWQDQLDNEIADIEAALLPEEAAFYQTITEHDLAKGWPQRFKELRLWIVEQALDELEIHANNALVELGLRDWSIEFQVERETKSGTISRGFEIIVHSPESWDGAPWESWSGGETQRLRIACAVGLANLIRSRMPSAPDFEVWDEPTAHLNVEGVSDLIAFMNDRADRRQIWVVDHRSLDSGAFDGVLTVTKTAAGSTLGVKNE